MPISELQADSLSFGYRRIKPATQVIAFIHQKLTKFKVFFDNKVTNTPQKSSQRKLNYLKKLKVFKSFQMRESNKESKEQLFCYDSFYYLDFSVKPYMGQIDFKVTSKKIPLLDKYLFFIEAWFQNKKMVFESAKRNNLQKAFVINMLQNCVFGSVVLNTVLDGLQDFILKFLPLRCTKFIQELKYAPIRTNKVSAKSTV